MDSGTVNKRISVTWAARNRWARNRISMNSNFQMVSVQTIKDKINNNLKVCQLSAPLLTGHTDESHHANRKPTQKISDDDSGHFPLQGRDIGV